MIKKTYTYKATLATLNGYRSINLYTRRRKELNIVYDYGEQIRVIKYKNNQEAVEDFYNKIRFLQKYGNEVNLTLAGSNFIMKGGIL